MAAVRPPAGRPRRPRSDELVGRARTIPFAWDGTHSDLPPGFDARGERALNSGRAATALSALAAEILDGHQGEGLSRVVVAVMADLARSAGLAPLVVPLHPSRKEQYPLIPIEDYASWRRDDGLPFDPSLAERQLDVDPAQVRAWARAHGFAVGGRGRIPGEITAAYLARASLDAPVGD